MEIEWPIPPEHAFVTECGICGRVKAPLAGDPQFLGCPHCDTRHTGGDNCKECKGGKKGMPQPNLSREL